MGNVCLFGRLPSHFPHPQPGTEIVSLNFKAEIEDFGTKLMNVAALSLKLTRLKFDRYLLLTLTTSFKLECFVYVLVVKYRVLGPH